MSRIGFIGLGTMGAPMALNLLRAGHDVTATNRSPGRVEEFRSRGGQGSDSIAGTVDGADVVITMLPDSPDVEQVVLGEGGVLSAVAPGTLLIDMSSISPTTARAVAARAADRGVQALDAPVSGGEKAAQEGSLSIMIGGAAPDVEAARPVLSAMGTTLVHVGPAGAGQTVKAANQLLVAGHLQLLAEALTLLDAHGVQLDAAVEVLGGGLAGSTVIRRKAPGMLARDYTPSFRAGLHHKDLGILTDAAREAGVPLPLGGLLAQLMGALVAQGHSGLDHSALLMTQQALAGRLPRSS